QKGDHRDKTKQCHFDIPPNRFSPATTSGFVSRESNGCAKKLIKKDTSTASIQNYPPRTLLYGEIFGFFGRTLKKKAEYTLGIP
ncbi:MAG: hypothetical protein N2Z74_01695, partial [Syntrophales bacterium]|nr:hypothetical protein [Syntrophales bacterium]